MSLPYSSVVAISGVASKPALTVEKQHMLLAITSDLFPTSEPYLEFTDAASFGSYFGKNIEEYKQVNKYFNFLSKTGLTPDKVIVANYYKNAVKAFYKGNKITTKIDALKKINQGSFKINFNGVSFEVVIDLSTINTYSDIAVLIKAAINANDGDNFKNADCVFNTITNGLIITNGAEAGTNATIEAIETGATGTDIASLLGLLNCTLSNGANAETWAEYCDRVYNANSTGFSYTTLQSLTNDDIVESIEWLQTIQDDTTYNTNVRIVFNYQDTKENFAVLKEKINNDYQGFVFTYDPNKEFINILSCAICASTNYEAINGTKNFNFQPATGYTAITNYGTITDYQAGQTNLALVNELDNLKLNYVYSLGAGSQEKVYYGKGLINGAFTTEDIQCNEAWLEKDLQVAIINGFDVLEKVKLQGKDAKELMNKLILPTFVKGQDNGTIALGGTLTNTSKISIIQQTNDEAAVEAIENNGYYYFINDLTSEDIQLRRVRITVCYLAAGVVNKVVIKNTIYQG